MLRFEKAFLLMLVNNNYPVNPSESLNALIIQISYDRLSYLLYYGFVVQCLGIVHDIHDWSLSFLYEYVSIRHSAIML